MQSHMRVSGKGFWYQSFGAVAVEKFVYDRFAEVFEQDLELYPVDVPGQFSLRYIYGAKAPEHSREIFAGDRFGHEIIHAGRNALVTVIDKNISGEANYGHGPAHRPDLPRCFDAVCHRHLKMQLLLAGPWLWTSLA